MISRENVSHQKVSGRTIIAAFVMLAGVVLMGLGYFQNSRLSVYLGLAATPAGVVTEMIFVVAGGTLNSHAFNRRKHGQRTGGSH